MQLSVIQKYVHAFWIPFFPFGKTGISECLHCRQVLKLKEMPDFFREEYKNIKAKSRTPIYTFTGVIVLFLFLSFLTYESGKDEKKNKLLINSAQKGDVYRVRTEDFDYTLMKVERVNRDTVFVLKSELQADKISEISKIEEKGEEAYQTEISTYTKNELVKMIEEGEIFNVERK
ncbi:MAG: hypothetical protein ACKVQB_04815 [Bacteroidia bacterium]